MQDIKLSKYAIIIFGLAASFYLYEFILQISPSVMTHSLMRDLKLNSLGLGLLSSFYYYTYTPCQLIAGIAIDRFGPRLVLSLAVLVCAIGAVFFGTAQDFFLAGLGRLLIGAGSAFAFVGTLVLITRWFPATYFAFLVGLAQFMGSMGAIIGAAPLAKVVDIFSWRSSLIGLGSMGFFLGLLLWSVIRNWPKRQMAEKLSQKKASIRHNLGRVFAKTSTWIVGAYAFLVWAPITIFAGLWGIPFLAKAYGITSTQAGAAISMVWLGVAIGCPILGWWSDVSRRRKPAMLTCALFGIVATVLLIFVPLPLPLCYLCLGLFGVAAAGQSVSFGVVRDLNSVEVVGTAIGFNNMAIVAGGALFQPLVGWLLDIQWQGDIIDNLPYYSLANYRYALSVLPLCYILALVIQISLLKESYKVENS